MKQKKKQPSPLASDSRAWLWPPLLGFARGMAVVALLSVSMVMFKRLGMSNSWASCTTALLALPYMFRQLLRPLVMAMPASGWWMVGMQMLFAVAMLGVSLAVSSGGGEGSAIWWWLSIGAFAAAIHDILAADYCNSLRGSRKPGRTLVSATLPLLAIVLGMGATLVIAGDMEVLTRDVSYSWSLAFEVLAGVSFAVALASFLAKPSHIVKPISLPRAWRVQKRELGRWWRTPGQWSFAAFIVLFTLHECFILRGVLLFLVDPGSIGGLSLGPQEVAFAHSTVAGMAMVAGSVVGFTVMRRDGLRRWVWPMVASLTIPDILLLYLAYFMPSELSIVTVCLALESLGCGFGLAGFVRYLRYYAPMRGLSAYGDSCLALVALSACLSGVVTGVLQDYFGYRRFFIFVVLMAIVAAASLALPRMFSGRRRKRA